MSTAVHRQTNSAAPQGSNPSNAAPEQQTDSDSSDNALRLLLQQPGVDSYLIINRQGLPIKYHGMENNDALHYSALVSEFWLAVQNFLDTNTASSGSNAHLGSTAGGSTLQPPSMSASASQSGLLSSPQVQTLRFHTLKHELLITVDGEYTLVVIHAPFRPPVQQVAEVATNAANEGADGADREGEEQ